MTSDIDIPSPLVFTPIDMTQMDRVEAIRIASGTTLYVFTFASLFVWQEAEGYAICFDDDAFLVKHGVRGENVYMFPCGSDSGKKRLIDALLLHGEPVFSFIADEDKAFLEREYPGRFLFTECRGDYPYLYDKEEQIALSGKEFRKLRHQVNIGRAAAGEWTSEAITAENVERALLVNRKWVDARPDAGPADTAAAEMALCNFSRLGMWGLLFRADGEDAAYVAGCFVTPQIYDVSFSKVLDRRCDCFIKWALYRALPSEVKTVDSEEDLGIPGLRTHKLLRRPKELTRIWKGTLQ